MVCKNIECKIIAVEFCYWINNNWFIPDDDGFWKFDTENVDFERTIPEDGHEFWTGEQLFEMFEKGLGD